MINKLPERAQDQVGSLLVAHLNDGLESLGPDIGERLRFARERAVARARQARPQAATAPHTWNPITGTVLLGAASPGVGGLGSTPIEWATPLNGDGFTGSHSDAHGPNRGSSWWAKWVSALPLLILALGFTVIQDALVERQIQAAAEVDAALLADDLPTQAYTDPGFAEFLRAKDR